MIRLDGQGQQTLYCGAASFVQWSPDQKYLAFDQTTDPYQNIELLTLATGTLQTELHNATTSIASSSTVPAVTCTCVEDVASAHVMIGPGTDAHGVLDQARVLLLEHEIAHATIQVEPDDHAGCAELNW